MIELVEVDKWFGGKRAVDGVSLVVPSGSVTALLGLNGAGKTTLLRLVGGLDRPDGGSVSLCGRTPQAQRHPTRLLGVHLGPEAMSPRHTVFQHLAWLTALGGLESRSIARVLEEVGLTNQRSVRIAGLSLGSRQRLAIAGALLGDPAVLILDEPINGLDVPGIVWLRGLLRRLARDGRTVMVASHALGEVALTADRVAILERGTLVVAGVLSELVDPGQESREWLERTLLAQSRSRQAQDASR